MVSEDHMTLDHKLLVSDNLMLQQCPFIDAFKNFFVKADQSEQ